MCKGMIRRYFILAQLQVPTAVHGFVWRGGVSPRYGALFSGSVQIDPCCFSPLLAELP